MHSCPVSHLAQTGVGNLIPIFSRKHYYSQSVHYNRDQWNISNKTTFWLCVLYVFSSSFCLQLIPYLAPSLQHSCERSVHQIDNIHVTLTTSFFFTVIQDTSFVSTHSCPLTQTLTQHPVPQPLKHLHPSLSTSILCHVIVYFLFDAGCLLVDNLKWMFPKILPLRLSVVLQPRSDARTPFRQRIKNTMICLNLFYFSDLRTTIPDHYCTSVNRRRRDKHGPRKWPKPSLKN